MTIVTLIAEYFTPRDPAWWTYALAFYGDCVLIILWRSGRGV